MDDWALTDSLTDLHHHEDGYSDKDHHAKLYAQPNDHEDLYDKSNYHTLVHAFDHDDFLTNEDGDPAPNVYEQPDDQPDLLNQPDQVSHKDPYLNGDANTHKDPYDHAHLHEDKDPNWDSHRNAHSYPVKALKSRGGLQLGGLLFLSLNFKNRRARTLILR